MGSVTLKMTSQRMLWPKEPATAPLKVYRPDTAKANTQRDVPPVVLDLVPVGRGADETVIEFL